MATSGKRLTRRRDRWIDVAELDFDPVVLAGRDDVA